MATSKIKAQLVTVEYAYSGTYTVPSSCYLDIANGNEPFRGKKVVSVELMSWGSSTGGFNIVSSNGIQIYILANSGVRVVNPAIRVTYWN